MTKFIASAKKMVNRQDGATMVEYGLMLALIAIVCIVAVGAIGTSAKTLFNTVANTL
jgi:pilus assembly protein Flp/PilA